MTNHNSEQKGEGVEYMENVCPSCGFTDEIELPVNAKLEKALSFILELSLPEETEVYLRSYAECLKCEDFSDEELNSMEIIESHIALKARELLKELENG